MKQLFKKGEGHSFFNLRDLLMGVISMTVALSGFFLLNRIDDYLNPHTSDAARLVPDYILVSFAVLFLAPVVYIAYRRGWKSSIAVLLSGIVFLLIFVVLL